jgi:hypothetical protein
MLWHRLLVVIMLSLLAACSSGPAASNDSAGSPTTPAGNWSGDYGAGSFQRERIRVDLKWEEPNLTGVVYAGPRSLPLKKASFKPDTGAIRLEFETQGNRGQTVQYTIQGKISGDVMSGTWTHDDLSGDFKVTRQ